MLIMQEWGLDLSVQWGNIFFPRRILSVSRRKASGMILRRRLWQSISDHHGNQTSPDFVGRSVALYRIKKLENFRGFKYPSLEDTKLKLDCGGIKLQLLCTSPKNKHRFHYLDSITILARLPANKLHFLQAYYQC
jgi:hypothetical protein